MIFEQYRSYCRVISYCIFCISSNPSVNFGESKKSAIVSCKRRTCLFSPLGNHCNHSQNNGSIQRPKAVLYTEFHMAVFKSQSPLTQTYDFYIETIIFLQRRNESNKSEHIACVFIITFNNTKLLHIVSCPVFTFFTQERRFG